MRTIAVVLAIAATPCPGNADPLPTAEELEKAAVSARTSIRSGYVDFSISTRSGGDGQQVDRVSDRRTWFDGNKVRTEYAFQKGPDEGVRKLECRNCERDGWGIVADDRPTGATEFHPLGSAARPTAREAIDPRHIGYYPLNYVTLAAYPPNKLFDAAADATKTVSRVSDRGLDGYAVAWKTKQQVDIEVRIAPGRGHAITRISLTHGGGKTGRQVILESDLPAAPVDGVWYPSRVVLTKLAGGQVEQIETIAVHLFRPNVAHPPDTFTLAGAQLKPLPYVITPNPAETGFLRDGKIDNTPNQNVRFEDVSPPVPIGTPASTRVNYWLVATCATCAAGAIAVVAWRRRRGA
ncbi:MAG TPA: hypothetical protein VH092_24975 [Urbifossiella sp.]|jgi:hypothetical protein|nr:hypothetical protein [Urbifossiella sp.]